MLFRYFGEESERERVKDIGTLDLEEMMGARVHLGHRN
jgi:hypothetical protein